VVSLPPDAVAPTLEPRLRAVLDLERTWWKLGVPKERAIREHLGLSTTRYHQLLTKAIDMPQALAYDPMLVRRLRRLRETRRRKRFEGRLGLRS
jgi:Protein of unknown function (DUF3263)